MKWVNHFNYKPSPGEVNSGELKTIPNEAYTVRELLEKYATGIQIDLERNVDYIDEGDFGTKRLFISKDADLTDIDELRKDVELKKERLNGVLKKVREPKNEEKPKEKETDDAGVDEDE